MSKQAAKSDESNPMLNAGAPAESQTHEVIYRPGPQDPVETRFHGINFKANVPVKVSAMHTGEALLTQRFESKDGTMQSRAVERRIKSIDLLRGNPFFEVDGVRAERATLSSKLPDNPDAYRGYAISWITQSHSGNGIRQRWDAEEGLRVRCGCQSEDVAYIMPFLEMKIQECGEAGIIAA